jgi:hypothetical protein
VSDNYEVVWRLAGSNIDISVLLQDDLLTIQADEGQIQQVVVTLAATERDAMPYGGLLRIETENLTVDVGYAKSLPLSPPSTFVGWSPTMAWAWTRKPNAALLKRSLRPKNAAKAPDWFASVYEIVKQSGGYMGPTSPLALAQFSIYMRH